MDVLFPVGGSQANRAYVIVARKRLDDPEWLVKEWEITLLKKIKKQIL
ncbi:MAG: hypothetical protein HQL77_07860 [Magnetococcales bacterium]|nr:hypothetical protein [Magnetococcales bacterium]